MNSQVLGVLVASVAGGDEKDMQTGAWVAGNATNYNRQLHPDEIEFASDRERVQRYADEHDLSEGEARLELLRTAAALVDRGWNDALTEVDGKTERAASFLESELASHSVKMFQATPLEYNNERLGLIELFSDKQALQALLVEVALVDPLDYKTNPQYYQEVLNAKGLGSQEGFGNAVENLASAPSKTALWLMGAANCPDCALADIQQAWDAVASMPEELKYKGYLDNLHIMQGKGFEVIKGNAASSTELGVGVGLAVTPVLGRGGAKATGKDYVDILFPEAKKHILYGDKPGSGGHMWPGQSGKTVFPQSWSADKIVHEVGDIATSPNTKWYAQTGTGGIYTSKGDPAKWVAYEVRDGVRMRVVYQPAAGKVITAFPDNAPIPPYKLIK